MQLHTHEDEVGYDESESGKVITDSHSQLCAVSLKSKSLSLSTTTLTSTSLRHLRESCPKLKLILVIK